MSSPRCVRHCFLASALAIGLLWLPSAQAASSWNPTLIVNTEAFQEIDNSNATANIQLKFGSNLDARVFYDITNARFAFTKPIFVQGAITATGTLTVRATITGSALNVSRNATVGGTFTATGTVHGVGPGSFSGRLMLESGLTGATLAGFGLTNCVNGTNDKLLWNSATEKFSCGSDQTGASSGLTYAAGDARYVEQAGDTMTGALNIRPTAGPLTFGLNVAAAMSGRSLQVTGTGARPILYTDVTRGYVGIGTTTPTKQLTISGGSILQIAGGTPGTLSGVDLATTVNAVYVSGNYAYVGLNAATGNDFRAIDISDPNAPSILGGYEAGTTVKALFISTKHAFLGLSGAAAGSGLVILDNTNPASPYIVGRINFGSNVNSVYVSGKYVYVGLETVTGPCSRTQLTGCEFNIVDFTNPNAPSIVGGLDVGTTVHAVYVHNRYAYLGLSTAAGNDFRIIDLSNPAAPVTIGGLDESNSVKSVFASGRFAYLGLAADAGAEFRVIDISNKGSPVQVGSLETGTGVNAITLAGDWARLGIGNNTSGDELVTVDLRTSITPKKVGGLELGTDVNSLFIAGKYAYAGLTSTAGNDLRIVDIDGIEAPVGSIGSIHTSQITVADNGRFDNNVYVRNALNVGRGGIISKGPLSIQSTGTGSIQAGTGVGLTAFEVRNGTGQLLMSVTDDGRVFAGMPNTSTGAAELFANQGNGRKSGWIAPITTAATTTNAVGMTNPTVITITNAAAKPSLNNARTYIMWGAPNTANAGGGVSGTYTETKPTYRPRLSLVMMTSTGTSNQQFWAAITEGAMTTVTPSMSAAAQTNDYVGIGYSSAVNSTRWMCCSGDGSNHSCTNMGIAVSTNTEYGLQVDFSQPGKLICRVIAGAKTYTTIKTTNISTTNTTLGVHIGSTALATGNNCRTFYFGKAQLDQN